MPIMTVLSSAIAEEQDLKRREAQKRKSNMEQWNKDKALQSTAPKRFVNMPPAKRG